MKVEYSDNKCDLMNEDIRWYLFEQCLWITKYKNYSDIENRIGVDVVGSFNWLYEVNDTILFNRNNGIFEIGIINLSCDIEMDDKKADVLINNKGKYGKLKTCEMKDLSFEFDAKICYSEKLNCLYAFPNERIDLNYYIIWIVEDFGFIVFNENLAGWILKNASNHIFIDNVFVPIEIDVLKEYIITAKQIEEDDYSGIKRIISECSKKGEDENSKFIKALKDLL